MVATAVEAMSAFEHTDAAFTADAPSLSPTKPALVFVGAPRGRLRPLSRQNHASDAPFSRGTFVGRRAEAAIACGQVRCAAKDRLMAIQRRRPQGHVSRSSRVHLVGRNDLMFRFLNRDQLAKLVG